MSKETKELIESILMAVCLFIGFYIFIWVGAALFPNY